MSPKEEPADRKKFDVIISAYDSNLNKISGPRDWRLNFVWIFFVIFAIIIVSRLIILMIFQHQFYLSVATGSRETWDHLFPNRGGIYAQDTRTGEKYPLAMNRDYFILFADTRAIKDDDTANQITNKLSEIFNYDDQRKLAVYMQLNKRNDPYEPIEKKVEDPTVKKIEEMQLPGIYFARKSYRYYPENELAAPIVGFVGQDDNGNDVGRYGIEGYWNKELAGSGGFVNGAKSAIGGWIPLSGWNFKPAMDGADIILTIDRTLQYKSCEILRQGMQEFKAESASLIIMEPSTGAVRAMCSLPDFNPNEYSKVESLNVYNNSAIFTAYEPGSIFKPITMSAVVNEKLVTPTSYFLDTGSRSDLCSKPIKNANDTVFGSQTMSGVLENSINTGMVYVTELLGRNRFVKYVQNFGFGIKTGIELDTETPGTISSLLDKRGNQIDCYAATASFGQGIMATPIQLVSAYSAIVNGGKIMKPTVVKEITYADGKTERFKPKEIVATISNQASVLTKGMLVNVVEKGHSRNAKIDGYYVGGKTGTAQIAGKEGYTLDTNQSFVGFAPADDPKFVILVKFEKPNKTWADSTASPIFKQVAEFALNYYGIAPKK